MRVTSVVKFLREKAEKEGKKVRAHHGDCIGGDEEFHKICAKQGIGIILHPPINETKRAFCKKNVWHENLPKEYLDRNHDIVDECSIMLVGPKSSEEELRSGTWATYRYSIKRGKEIYLIPPTRDVRRIDSSLPKEA